MNEILVWLIDAAFMLVWHGFLYIVLPILALSFLWPYISDMIKLIGLLVPLVIVVFAFWSNGFWSGLLWLGGALLFWGLLGLITNALDGQFGVAVPEEDAHFYE